MGTLRFASATIENAEFKFAQAALSRRARETPGGTVKISTKGLYAVRFMVVLAQRGEGSGPVPLKEIADSTGISRKYLEQIASSLAAAQLVRSSRGASGGYRLASSASKISILDVLTVTEGSLAPVDYLDDLTGTAGPGESSYEVFVWRGLHDLIKGYLDGISLQDVVERSSQLAIDSYSI